MATADELRSKIQQSREAFREALNATNGKWEDGTDDNWGAKRVAQHVVRAEVGYANRVSTAMEGKPQDPPNLELASAEEALAKHEESAAMADKAFRYVEDRDLTKRAEVPGEFPQTVEGVLAATAAHIANHAEQLKSL